MCSGSFQRSTPSRTALGIQMRRSSGDIRDHPKFVRRRLRLVGTHSEQFGDAYGARTAAQSSGDDPARRGQKYPCGGQSVAAAVLARGVREVRSVYAMPSAL